MLTHEDGVYKTYSQWRSELPSNYAESYVSRLAWEYQQNVISYLDGEVCRLKLRLAEQK